jgi:uncharacterized protein YjiS (DUF1127 family)
MFKSLNRIRAAFAQARKRRRTTRELNSLPPEIRKDIGWPEADQDEIRLPF